MQALKDTAAALGKPILARTFGIPTAPVAAVARWRHGAVQVEVAPSNTIQLVMSLVDGRNARNLVGGMLADQVRGGSISVFSPAEGARVSVTGEADVLQIFVRQAYAEEALDAPYTCPSMFDLRDSRMQAMALRVLVGIERCGPDDTVMVEEGLQTLALLIDGHADERRSRVKTPPKIIRGGLSPTSFRRVEEIVETALDESSSVTLGEMARAAGLSVTHFVRAFREHNGVTPHKYLVRRRINRAVSSLRAASVSVAEVADRSGFSTPAHFVAAFRAATGVTPGAVRDALAG